MLGVLGLAAACTRNPLPDLGFGTAADEAGEGEGEAGAGSATTSADSGETVASGEGSESWTSVTDEGVPDGTESGAEQGESGTDEGSGSSEGSTSASSSSSSEESTSVTGGPDEGFEGFDTWGIPPDVTNEPCEPLTQDCFPTHKCVPYATQPGSSFLDANKCMPILGDKQWGEPCTLSSWHEGQDDCDGDGFCWNIEWVGGEMHGTCVPFCVGSPQDLSCPLGWGCLFTGAVSLCEKQCNPLLQDCPQDYGCYWEGNAFDCALVSSIAGDKQACDEYNDCLPGFACVDKGAVPGCVGSDPNCCTPVCDWTLDVDPCDPPRSCQAFFGPGQAPPGQEAIGICVL